ncbi:MAG: PCRF domain-containing protein, partial [Clostridia bacterium]|nr:PCRF domain-containing protein [Clostridia bacterium]
MLHKLRETEQKFIGIEDSLGDPNVMSDPQRYASLMKEYKALTPLIEKYREYKACSDNISGIEEMLAEGLDAEMRQLCEDELKEEKAKIEILAEEL